MSPFVLPVRQDSFAERKRRANPAALVLSVSITSALMSLLLFLSGTTDRLPQTAEALALFAVTPDPPAPPPPPEERPVDQPEIMSQSAEDSAPSSRPRTLGPAPALPVIPPVRIDLVPVPVPEVPIADEGLQVMLGGNSKGDLAEGPAGRGGQGGNGIAGDGKGVAGMGKGTGTRLIASWAPGMDLTQTARFYPPAARRARIEGVVLLECFVLSRDRVRHCRVLSEKPAGFGFGEAALRIERGLRVRLHTLAGERVYNRWARIDWYFVLGQNEATETFADEGKGEAASPQ